MTPPNGVTVIKRVKYMSSCLTLADFFIVYKYILTVGKLFLETRPYVSLSLKTLRVSNDTYKALLFR